MSRASPPPALEQQATALGDFQALAPPEGVVVGDDDLGALDLIEEVAGDQFTAGVIAVGVAGLEDPQAVPDGDPGGDDEKAARKLLGAPSAYGVDGLPGDQHGHDGGLASPGGELEGQAHQLWVGVAVGIRQVLEEAFAGLADLGRDLGQPDGGLDGLDLAKEGADAAEGVMAPMLEETGRLGGDPPMIRVRVLAPAIHLLAKGVDDGGVIVALILGTQPHAFIERYLALLARAALFLGFGDRGDELRATPGFKNPLSRLTGGVQFPMAPGAGIGGIENRPIKEGVAHGCLLTIGSGTRQRLAVPRANRRLDPAP